MIQIALLAAATIYPAIAILSWIQNRDQLPEPQNVVVKTTVLGGLSVIPVLFVAIVLSIILGIPLDDDYSTLRNALLTAFVLAALNEEFFKFLVLRGYSARHDAFDEPFDGIVYGVAASIGFAIVENVLYVFSGWMEGGIAGGWQVAIPRALTAIPGHAACGVILGACIGIGRFNPGRGWMILGFLAAVAFHGAYDAFLMAAMVPSMQDAGLAMPLIGGFVITFVLELVVAGLAIARLRRDQIRWNSDREEASGDLGPDVYAGTPMEDHGGVPRPPRPPSPPSPPKPVGVPRWPISAMLFSGGAALMLMVFFVLTVGVAVAAENQGREPGESVLVMIGMVVLVAGGLGFVGFVLSICALAMETRWKAASIIALLASIAVLGLLVSIMALGAAME